MKKKAARKVSAEPAGLLYGEQTRLAIENFPVSGLCMPQAFLAAVFLVKRAAAQTNADLGLLDAPVAAAIVAATEALLAGHHSDQFPVDVFQTGSATSTHMNVNEVIANLASATAPRSVHANDDVNIGQSSNDVVPTAIHVSAVSQLNTELLPALEHLQQVTQRRGAELEDSIVTGRTHLMDAMPISFGQELSGWATQIAQGRARIESCLPRLRSLALGGTAVGTGVNAHPQFASEVIERINSDTGETFAVSENYFESLSCQDTAVELSGQLRTLAVSLMKIANDLRWMNSGPQAGLGDIKLQALQPGSSIMPGKVNPVIPESVCMVAAQVMGNDATIAVAGQSGNFQLNVMLPLIAHNLLQSIQLLANAARLLADKAIATFEVNAAHARNLVERNPVLVTALNSRIGYDKAAEIAKQAYREGRPVLDVALEHTDLSRQELEQILDPVALANPGRSKD